MGGGLTGVPVDPGDGGTCSKLKIKEQLARTAVPGNQLVLYGSLRGALLLAVKASVWLRTNTSLPHTASSAALETWAVFINHPREVDSKHVFLRLQPIRLRHVPDRQCKLPKLNWRFPYTVLLQYQFQFNRYTGIVAVNFSYPLRSSSKRLFNSSLQFE